MADWFAQPATIASMYGRRARDVLMDPSGARTMPPASCLSALEQPHHNRTQVTMNTIYKSQQGISAIGLIIILAIIGTGIYIGLQYIPQFIECNTVDSILDNLETANSKKPISSVKELRDMIGRQLEINQMDELRDSFTVTQDGDKYIVKVNYERELNLIYEKKPMKYEKSLTLE
jgi:hypothetical protein